MEQRLSFDAYQLHGDFIVPSWLVWGIGFKKLLFLLKTPPENLRKLIQKMGKHFEREAGSSSKPPIFSRWFLNGC